MESEDRNISDSHRQTLDKGQQMANIIKSKLDQTKNSKAIWLVTTIKKLIIKPLNKLRPPVFSFKQTQ